jgi:hypothetical protein
VTTGRVPRYPADELGATLPDPAEAAPTLDLEPIRAVGSGDNEPVGYALEDVAAGLHVAAPTDTAERRRLDAAYYDRGRNDADAVRNVDLDARVSALEAALPSAATNARWIKRGVVAIGSAAGLGAAVFVYVLAFADARGAAREREAIRAADHTTILGLVVSDAVQAEQLRAITATLARYPIGFAPVQGPPPRQDSP